MSDRNNIAPTRRRRFGIWLLLSLVFMAGIVALAGLSLTGRVISLPEWVTKRIEARLTLALDPLEIALGGVDVAFSRKGVPQVHLRNVTLADNGGRPVARMPDLVATLAAKPLTEGRIVVRRVALHGAEMTLGRAADGRFDLAFGGVVSPANADSLAEVLNQIDLAFELPALAAVEGVTIDGLTLRYEDARARRSWVVHDGLMTLDQTEDLISARLFFSLTSDLGEPSEMAFSFETVKGSPEARVSANFSDMPSYDVATQSPALAFLTVIDAPISGAMRAGLGPDGALQPLSAALEIGKGELKPAEGAEPIRFDRGKSYFTFDPDSGKITFDEIAVETSALKIQSEGHAYLRDEVDGWPTSLVTQMQLREVILTPEGVFAEPARFTGGAVDMKLTLDPFTARIGQAVLLDEAGAAYRGRGTVTAGFDGWRVNLDLSLDQITHEQLMALWPLDLVPGTRRWMTNNVQKGLLFDIEAAIRLASDHPPRVQLTHEFRDATVKFMPTMPPVENGYGYNTLTEESFLLVLDSGSVTAPDGGILDAAGTVVKVADITRKPALGEITLRAKGSVPSMLSILDLPPLNLMKRAGLPVTLADGRAEVEAQLGVEFRKKVKPEEVDYTVAGTLSDVRSEVLVKNRTLTADRLDLSADKEELSISGAARLDGVPVQGVWSQKNGPEHRGKSRFEGSVELSQRFIDTFRIGLPAGTVSGDGIGNVTLDLTRGEPTKFELTSDLNRIGLRLPALSWSKAKASKGSLEVSGELGPVPKVDRFALSAPGMSAEGVIDVKADGTLDAARFSRVRVGGWLDAPVILSGRGAGRTPAVAITGGTMDLRQSPFSGKGGSSAGSGAPGQTTPIDVALDRLQVSRSIVLNTVRGQLSQDGGLNGRLTATVAGGAPVAITLAPGRKAGTAVRVISEDAGGVLRGAGLFERSNGGSLELILQPRGAPGDYDGKLVIKRTRVRGTSVLTELLSAISVVGLLELLDGEGIVFSEVDGVFRLTPTALHLRRGSAIGPSLGVSMAGVYDLNNNRLDMQGVVSPIYMLNFVGSLLTRKGEGLFGFNYRMTGDAKNPRVAVNPLSILTPGMFREIFRSPPPELGN